VQGLFVDKCFNFYKPLPAFCTFKSDTKRTQMHCLKFVDWQRTVQYKTVRTVEDGQLKLFAVSTLYSVHFSGMDKAHTDPMA
jgi:hypothetical protein